MNQKDLTHHKFSMDYFGTHGDKAIAGLLSSSLRGKPDTPGWRTLFKENDKIPVPYNGMIISREALLDFYKLIEVAPEKVHLALPPGMKKEDLPRLEDII